MPAGGWATSRRIILGVLTGLAVSFVYSVSNNALAFALGAPRDMAHSFWMALWSCLIFTILATIGAIVRELRAPEPHP